MQITIVAPITFMAAASLLSADAFAPTHRMMSSRSTLGGGGGGALQIMMASDKPLTELCEITKEACEAVAPMLNGEIRCCVPADILVRTSILYGRSCNTVLLLLFSHLLTSIVFCLSMSTCPCNRAVFSDQDWYRHFRHGGLQERRHVLHHRRWYRAAHVHRVPVRRRQVREHCGRGG